MFVIKRIQHGQLASLLNPLGPLFFFSLSLLHKTPKNPNPSFALTSHTNRAHQF